MVNNIFGALYDFHMTYDGDLVVEKEDLKKVNGSEWFIQQVNKILRTNNPGWEGHPNIGANLEDFIGEPNTRAVGKAIEERIYSKITAENLHYPGELEIRVVPINKDSINIHINLIIDGQPVVVSKTIFDIENGILKEIQQPQRPKNQTIAASNKKHNPYINRIR